VGHSQNQGRGQNQPKKEALDTNKDKSLEEAKPPSEEEQKKEETGEAAETTEGIEEEETTETAKEEGVEEEKTEEAEEAEVAEELKEEAAKEVSEEETPEEVAPTEVEEEEKEEEKKRKEAPEEEIVEERIYTIPLSRAWIAPRKKRAPRAVRIMKTFVQKHMKIETKARTEEEEEEAGRLVVSDEVNKKLWSRGIEKPPRNIRVRAVKNKEGIVTLYLAEGD